jgi:hypothetical protein
MANKNLTANNGGLAYDGSGVANSPTFNLNQAAKYGSLLNPLLEKIIHKYDPYSGSADDDELPDPDEKIEFNDIKVFAENIKECIGFQSVVEEQIDTIDDEVPGSKNKFLKAINQNYKNHRRTLLIEHGIDPRNKNEVICIIRSNADKLIQNVSKTILDHAEVDLHRYPVEDVQDSTNLIVCYGFINCQILERPNDYK